MSTPSESSRRAPSKSAAVLASLFMSVALLASPAHAKGGSPTPAPTPAPVPAPKPAPTPAPTQQAVMLGFDDFIASPYGVHMPAGYGGFVWGDRWFTMTNTVTGNNHLAVGSGLSIVIRSADGTPFYFDGADFWSRRGLDAVGDFYFVLYYQGKTVYNGLTAKKGKKVFTGTPARIAPDYTGPVDGVAFAFDSSGLDWNHLAVDNFRFRIDVK